MCRTPATRRSNRTILAEIPRANPPDRTELRQIQAVRASAGAAPARNRDASRNQAVPRRWASVPHATRTRSIPVRRGRQTLPVAVWGTGNMGRAAIRAVDAHPGLELTAVILARPAKVGRDAGDLAGPRPRPGRTRDHGRGRGAGRRPGGRLHGLRRHPPRRRARRHRARACAPEPWSSPRRSTRSTTTRSAPAELRDPVLAAVKEGGGSLFVSRRRPGLGQRRAAGAGQRARPAPSTRSAARRSSTTPPTTSPTPCGTWSAWASRWTTSRRWWRPASRPWCGAARSG